MPTGDQYLTVQEFAQRAGVTVQAVYQRLEKDLKSYLKAEKGRKYIHSDALQYMKHSSDIKADSSQIKEDSRNIQEDSSQIKGNSSDIKADSSTQESGIDLQSVIDTLREQLAVKDKQISDLAAALQTAQTMNESLTTALTAAQALHAGTLQQIGEKAAPDPVPAETASTAAEPMPEPRTAPPESDAAAPTGSERKPGLFARIFRRRKESK